jgi:hypothetical protein
VSAAVVQGKIYAIGGNGPSPSFPDTIDKFPWVEEYDPGVGSWVWFSPFMPTSRDDAAIAVVSDTIYVMGGYSASYLDVVEAFDPLTTTVSAIWQTKEPMPDELAMQSGAAVGELIYAMGGLDGGGDGGTTHLLVYDPISDTWDSGVDMPLPRSAATAGVVYGQIYLIGGGNTSGQGRMDHMHSYFPGGAWTEKNWMPTKRDQVAGAVGTVGGKQLIYVFGGRRSWDGEVTDVVEAVDVNCSSAPPDEPASPSPGNWDTDVLPLDTDLGWTASGASSYDVYFGKDVHPHPGDLGTSTPELVAEDLGAIIYDPGTLEPDTSYVWRIVAKNGTGAVTSLRERWTFTTGAVATVTKIANPTTVPEPEGTVAFTVEVVNDYDGTITLDGLVDDVYGNLNGQGDCSVSQEILKGNSYSCTFSGVVSGNADYTETDTVTATIDYGSTSTFDVFASATVTVTDVLPNITVTKTANPTDLAEPGGDFTFTVEVRNNGDEDVFLLNTLTDDVHGDVSSQGTCSVPQTIGPGNTYSCAFTATVTGSAGYSETDTVTATVHDDENNIVQAFDSATVTISEAHPGIQVVIKPSGVSALPGETITYTYRVENTGNVSLDSVSANDDRLGVISLDATTLAPSEFATGFATYVVKESDWPGVLGNTVTASGTPPVGDVVTDTDTTTVRVGSTIFLPVISSNKTFSTFAAVPAGAVTSDAP